MGDDVGNETAIPRNDSQNVFGKFYSALMG